MHTHSLVKQQQKKIWNFLFLNCFTFYSWNLLGAFESWFTFINFPAQEIQKKGRKNIFEGSSHGRSMREECIVENSKRWDILGQKKNGGFDYFKEEQKEKNSPSWPAIKKEYFLVIFHFFFLLLLFILLNFSSSHQSRRHGRIFLLFFSLAKGLLHQDGSFCSLSRVNTRRLAPSPSSENVYHNFEE